MYNIQCCLKHSNNEICESGGTGRRARLRGVWISPYGFKSRFSHQQKQNICLPTSVLFLFIQAAGLAYHHDAVVDIISLFGAVYHHAPACIFLRLDDIQHFVLMICNSYGIDDIQGFALITFQNHGIIYYSNLNLTR